MASDPVQVVRARPDRFTGVVWRPRRPDGILPGMADRPSGTGPPVGVRQARELSGGR